MLPRDIMNRFASRITAASAAASSAPTVPEKPLSARASRIAEMAGGVASKPVAKPSSLPTATAAAPAPVKTTATAAAPAVPTRKLIAQSLPMRCEVELGGDKRTTPAVFHIPVEGESTLIFSKEGFVSQEIKIAGTGERVLVAKLEKASAPVQAPAPEEKAPEAPKKAAKRAKK